MPVGFMTAVALVVRVVRFMLRGTAEEARMTPTSPNFLVVGALTCGTISLYH